MEIRLAKASDISRISDLYHELFAEMALLQPKGFAPAQQSRMFLRNIIHSNDHAFFLACNDNGEAVGFAVAEETETPDYNALIKRRYAYLMDIVVAREYRGGGIGTCLIEQVRSWAVTRKLEYVELNVLAQNLHAIELYNRLGFQNAKHVMQMPLQPCNE